MTPEQIKRSGNLIIAGGIVKVLSQLLYWVIDHYFTIHDKYDSAIISFKSTIYFSGGSLKDVLFWLATTSIYRKIPYINGWCCFFLFIAVNDLIDEVGSPILSLLLGRKVNFTNPTEMGWNEFLLFFILIIWLYRTIKKCRTYGKL